MEIFSCFFFLSFIHSFPIPIPHSIIILIRLCCRIRIIKRNIYETNGNKNELPWEKSLMRASSAALASKTEKFPLTFSFIDFDLFLFYSIFISFWSPYFFALFISSSVTSNDVSVNKEGEEEEVEEIGTQRQKEPKKNFIDINHVHTS